MTNFNDKLVSYIAAGQPAIYVTTFEESRAIHEIGAVTKKCGRTLIQWRSIDKNLHSVSINKKGESVIKTHGDDAEDPLRVVQILHADICSTTRTFSPGSVILLPDYYHFWREYGPDRVQIMRYIKDIVNICATIGTTIIVTGPSLYLPEDLQKEFITIDFTLPDEAKIIEIVDEFLSLIDCGNIEITTTAQETYRSMKYDVINALKGLTESEIKTAVAMAFSSAAKNVATQPDMRLSISELLEHKAQIIKRSGICEWMDVKNFREEYVGGLEIVKGWLKTRKKAFTHAAREYGIPEPRGMILLGPSGTGKTLIAKTAASILNLPIVRVKMGQIFGSLVGESEKNMQYLTKTLEAIAPCIAMFDEMEKALGGSGANGSNDGGTTKRVFGEFLSWLQDRKNGVFVVGTANDISDLPPELMRKGGRFDEIFFVDYPNKVERAQIWDIHLSKILGEHRDPEIDVNALVNITENWTGAEIESAVVDAMMNGFDLGMDKITQELVEEAVKSAVTLWETMKEKVQEMRTKFKNRAKKASYDDAEIANSLTTPSVPSNGGRKMKI